MDKGGRVRLTPAGMGMGVEPMCEAQRDVECIERVIIRDMAVCCADRMYPRAERVEMYVQDQLSRFLAWTREIDPAITS